MMLRMKNNLVIKTIRVRPAGTVEELRALLREGAEARPDSSRKNFYELKGGERVFYTVCAVGHSGLAGARAGELQTDPANRITMTLGLGGSPPPATAPSQRPRLNKAVPPAPCNVTLLAVWDSARQPVTPRVSQAEAAACCSPAA